MRAWIYVCVYFSNLRVYDSCVREIIDFETKRLVGFVIF